MDNNLTEKLQNILGDKDAVEKLKQLAENMNFQGNLSNNGNQNGQEENENIQDQENGGNMSGSNGNMSGSNGNMNQNQSIPSKHSNEDHVKLLNAIRPYLSPERREMADNIIQILRLMKLADLNKLLRG